jgi:predicted RNA binding protein YcfA (HicA-like mRNA interferase family)
MITADKFKKTLFNLGFFESQVKGSHRTFRHPSSGTTVVLPWRQLDKYVSPAHLISIKRTLSETGVLDRDSFERLLEKSA